MRVLRASKQLRVLPPASRVSLQRPEHDGVALEEVDEPLSVSIPQLPAEGNAAEGAQYEAPQDERQGVVKKDHGIDPFPDDVAHGAVVAVYNPGVTTERVCNTLPNIT